MKLSAACLMAVFLFCTINPPSIHAGASEIVISPEEWKAASVPPPPGPRYEYVAPDEEKAGTPPAGEPEKAAVPEKTRPAEVTDEDFMPVINKSSKPLMLVFWQASCPDCMRMKGAVDSIAAEGKVKVITMNVMHNQAVPEHFEVTGLPAFFLIKGGSVVSNATGVMSKAELKKKLGI